MNRRGFIGLIAGLLAALSVKPDSRMFRGVKKWNSVHPITFQPDDTWIYITHGGSIYAVPPTRENLDALSRATDYDAVVAD